MLAAHDYRLHECNSQIDAMRRGLFEILSPLVLGLFSWREVEERVCGQPDFDIAWLKRNTMYNGLQGNEPHVEWFWRALADFTPEQRRAFVRFVWGRSRLPASGLEFERKFEVQPFYPDDRADVDKYLPVVRTRFFLFLDARLNTYHWP